MKYFELKQKQQKKVDNFNLGFCFSQPQFEDMMKKWNLTPNDTDKIVSIGFGGYCLKTEINDFINLMKNNDNELKEFLKNDKNLKDALIYELANHEYCITFDASPTLEALGLTIDDLKDKRINKIFI